MNQYKGGGGNDLEHWLGLYDGAPLLIRRKRAGDTTVAASGMKLEDMDGYEYELGVSWKFMPLLSLRAGYRETSIDFTETDGVTDTNGSAESTGFLAGLGIHF